MDVFHWMSNDRLHAPNTEAAFAEILPNLQAVAELLYPGQAVSLTRLDNDPRERLTVVVDAGVPVAMRDLMQTIAV